MIYDVQVIVHFNLPVRRGFYFPSTATRSGGSLNMNLDKVYCMNYVTELCKASK
jgi:hypothetical protein